MHQYDIWIIATRSETKFNQFIKYKMKHKQISLFLVENLEIFIVDYTFTYLYINIII